jgi:hypothetical protein
MVDDPTIESGWITVVDVSCDLQFFFFFISRAFSPSCSFRRRSCEASSPHTCLSSCKGPQH